MAENRGEKSPAAPVEKDQGGRPPYQPTEKDRANVKMLASVGVRDTEIARVVGVSAPTLRKYYGDDLDAGHILANAQVARSLYRMATDRDKPSVAAAIFWLKCRAGWREDGGQPLPPPPGKKEQAAAAAITAADGTDWDSLLPRASDGPALQ
jgi:predicted ATP-grasp superfamily ATP-dependent carboligase